MNFFATFLLNVFSALFQWLSKYVSRKFALYGIAITALLSATTIFYVLIKGLVALIVYRFDNQTFQMFYYALWPSNANGCITACLAADVAGFLYRWKRDLIRMACWNY